MAITQARELEKIEIIPQNPPVMYLFEKITFDDTEDDQLPIVSKKRRVLQVSHLDNPEESSYEEVIPDVSGETQLIQDIAAVLWPNP